MHVHTHTRARHHLITCIHSNTFRQTFTFTYSARPARAPPSYKVYTFKHNSPNVLGKSLTCEALYELDFSRVSPDGKYVLFSRDYNLWVREISTGKERALTKDGERFYVYYGIKLFGYINKTRTLYLDSRTAPEYAL